jgi:hypothetical protein
VVRPGSAKAPCDGSIPSPASISIAINVFSGVDYSSHRQMELFLALVKSYETLPLLLTPRNRRLFALRLPHNQWRWSGC